MWAEPLEPVLRTFEQHHSLPRLRTSTRLAIAFMVGSSNAEKRDAIADGLEFVKFLSERWIASIQVDLVTHVSPRG